MNDINLNITNTDKHFTKPVNIGERFTEVDKAKLAKASRDFEGLLSTMMIKNMNKSTGGMFGENSYGGDVLDTMFEQEMASFMSQRQGLGIASMIYQKMTGEELPAEVIKSSYKSPKGAIKEFKINFEAPKIKPSSKTSNRVEEYGDIIKKASNKFGLNENIIKSIILTESAGNAKAVSSAKAKGLMQLMDSTATDMGVNNVFDPEENIMGGSKYFSKMLNKYDDNLELALAAYNAGPGNVDKYKGVPPFEETKNYINRVVGYYNNLEE